MHCPVTDTCADVRQQRELSHVYAKLIMVDGTFQSGLEKNSTYYKTLTSNALYRNTGLLMRSNDQYMVEDK